MEKIHWILEEDTFSEGNLDILVKAIKQFEGDTTLVKYIPFSTGAYVRSGNREDHLHQIYQEKKGVPTLIHGSVNLLQKVAHYSPVYPGSISVTWDNYNCSRYYPEFGEYMFNKNGCWYPIKELLRRDVVSSLEFVRPDTPTKEFKGGTYTGKTLPDVLKNAVEIDEDLWVYVAPVNTAILYATEYRVFCVGDLPVTASSYRSYDKHNTKIEIPESVYDFVYEVLDEVSYRPDPVFALDIIGTHDNYYIMEVSPWACAGMYNCDIPALVEAIHNYYIHYKDLHNELMGSA